CVQRRKGWQSASSSRRNCLIYDNRRDRNASKFWHYFNGSSLELGRVLYSAKPHYCALDTPPLNRQLATALGATKRRSHVTFRWWVRSASFSPSTLPAACGRTGGHNPVLAASFWGWIYDRERLALVRSIPLLLAPPAH